MAGISSAEESQQNNGTPANVENCCQNGHESLQNGHGEIKLIFTYFIFLCPCKGEGKVDLLDSLRSYLSVTCNFWRLYKFSHRKVQVSSIFLFLCNF